MRSRHHMVEALIPAIRKQIIDMLVAQHPTKAIMDATGASIDVIHHMAGRIGVSIPRERRSKYKPEKHRKDGPACAGVQHAPPEALQPWPPEAHFWGRNFTKADIALLRQGFAGKTLLRKP